MMCQWRIGLSRSADFCDAVNVKQYTQSTRRVPHLVDEKQRPQVDGREFTRITLFLQVETNCYEIFLSPLVSKRVGQNFSSHPSPAFPSQIRLPCTTYTQIRSQYLHSGNYQSFQVFQGNTITLAHFDEPYPVCNMKKYREFVETRFHKLEHESKMRLLKTYSRTSEQLGNEAEKKRQETRVSIF